MTKTKTKKTSIKMTVQRQRLLSIAAERLGTEGLSSTLDALLAHYLYTKGEEHHG